LNVSRSLENARREQIKGKLVPGRIIYHQFMFGRPPKPHWKYAIFLGVLQYEAYFLIIGTRPAPFIQAYEHLMDDQVEIYVASHDCLTYDSTIDCHSTEEVRIHDVHNALVSKPENLKGMLSDACRLKVCEVVEQSVNLEGFMQKFIITALKP